MARSESDDETATTPEPSTVSTRETTLAETSPDARAVSKRVQRRNLGYVLGLSLLVLGAASLATGGRLAVGIAAVAVGLACLVAAIADDVRRPAERDAQ